MSATARATPKDAWTPAEDEIVRNHYGHGVDATWEKLPHRSRIAVKQRAYDLGVTKPRWPNKKQPAPTNGREGWLTEWQTLTLQRLRAGWSATQKSDHGLTGRQNRTAVEMRPSDFTQCVRVDVGTLNRLTDLELATSEVTGERKIWRAVA